MLAAERLQKIVELVNERGSIRVTELSEICLVTEETIRRDLDKLEAESKLARSHGGAISIGAAQPEVPYFERETTNVEEKRNIAREAILRIEQHDRILLDASTTAWWMAKLLPDMPLTVLTNSIKVALELSSKRSIHVIATGGVLLEGSLSFVGPLAERSLDQYHVEKVFFSCKGVHLDRGVSESNELQALLKQKMISIADEVYLLADYSKFGVRAFAGVCGWDQIHHVVTDHSTDIESIQRLRERGVDVITLKS
ncbi:MAG: DeoR/GlpR transcriptional regulator [Gorillibacterium sp.]|nr:DeoR/GlpR transcriptional regulator [Gorillibacterium sp.]